MHGVGGIGNGPGSPAVPPDGSLWSVVGGRWKAAMPSDLSSVFTLAENSSATDIPGASFPLSTHRGGQLDYVVTRGSGITRKGTLQIAGDATSPSVADTAAAVGAAGITWSAVVSGGAVQVQIAVDNSVAVPIRVRWLLTKWAEP